MFLELWVRARGLRPLRDALPAREVRAPRVRRGRHRGQEAEPAHRLHREPRVAPPAAFGRSEAKPNLTALSEAALAARTAQRGSYYRYYYR